MSDPTGTPAAALLAAALRVIANLAGTLYVRQPDGLTVVQLLSHEYDERNAILAALTGTQRTQQPTGAGILNTWRGRLAGWSLQLVQWVPAPAAAAAMDEPCDPVWCVVHGTGQPAEADPGACSCWLTSRNGCPVHHLADEDEDLADEQPAPAEAPAFGCGACVNCYGGMPAICARPASQPARPAELPCPHICHRQAPAVRLAVCPVCGEHLADEDEDLAASAERAQLAWLASLDTSPATAAAEQPAGLVSSWPLTAGADADITQQIPAQRPPAEMLPAPSWALVGLESAFAPLVTPGPLTDKALTGREQTAEVA